MSALEPADLFPDTARVDRAGHLEIGGCDAVALAERYGTPLYLYDEASIVARARSYREALARHYPARSLVCYAAKAYAAPWLLRLVASEGLGLDVVSGGELHAAGAASFPADRVYFHGNNKGEDELEAALAARIGRVVVDNLDEVARLADRAAARRMRQAVLLRVAPGVDAHTHAHLTTGAPDTKFGLAIATGAAEEGVRAILARDSLDLRGFHAHIGSQVRELEPYRLAIERVLDFAREMRERHGVALRELSPGGGYAVRYHPSEPGADVAATIAEVARLVAEGARRCGFDPLPELTIEPGRAIVATAGVALYRVGSVKEIPGVRTYVAVDGGMADNIRPTAYGATYTAVLADRLDEAPEAEYAIAGKYCETGDVLIKSVRLPRPSPGDLVAVPVSGAYNLAMASNYNQAPRPAVVVVAKGEARLVRRRETYADLLGPDAIG